MAKRDDKKPVNEPPLLDERAADAAWRTCLSKEKLERLRRAWAQAQGKRTMPGEKDGGRVGDGPGRRRKK